MWLLNSKSLVLQAFLEKAIPPYAILSHTWDDGEVSFQEMQRAEADDTIKKKKGFGKISKCCQLAQQHELEWVWVDTCCIDKSSSAELSEAINSMYAWYRRSAICYAFLQDVDEHCNDGKAVDKTAACSEHMIEGSDSSDSSDDESRDNSDSRNDTSFAKAGWFTRGWCLQELIAPNNLIFFDAQWNDIGTKRSRTREVERITGVPVTVFLYHYLESSCIAKKLSWAAKRRTTRVEDEAYCLLGLLGINMTLIYSEGDRAFLRLQRKLIKQTEDKSIFCWRNSSSLLGWQDTPVLSPSPRRCKNLKCSASGEGHHAPALQDRLIDYSELSYVELSAVSRIKSDASPLTSIPTQMTSRGLKSSVLCKMIPDHKDLVKYGRTADKAVAYAVWTGCSYKSFYPCILLEKITLANRHDTYYRIEPGAVVLYSKKELESDFGEVEIYMAIKPVSHVVPRMMRYPRRAWSDMWLLETRPYHMLPVSIHIKPCNHRCEVQILDYVTIVSPQPLIQRAAEPNVWSFDMPAEPLVPSIKCRTSHSASRQTRALFFKLTFRMHRDQACCIVEPSSRDEVVKFRETDGISVDPIARTNAMENLSDRSVCNLAEGMTISANALFQNWVGKHGTFKINIRVDCDSEHDS